MDNNRREPFFSAVLDTSLLAFTIFVVPALLASILRFRDTGWLVLYPLQVLESIALVATFILRRRLAYRLRLTIFLTVIYLIGIQGALVFGIVTPWVMSALLCILLLTIFGGGWFGAFLAILTGFLLGSLGLATMRGWLRFPDTNLILHRPSTWLTIVFAFLLFSFIGVLAIGRLREYLLASLGEARKAQDAARQFNSELEERVRQRTAQLEETNRELEAFAYSASHDLRTPLRAIDGFSKLLGHEFGNALGEVGLGYIAEVRGAAREMDELIEGLLTLSRLTVSGMDIQEVDLSIIADAILRDLQRSEPNRRVDWHLEPGLVARADRRLMHAALHNLLENAWKFTFHRDMAEINFGREEQKGLTAYYVRDNGVGFDPGQAGSLFTAFQRLHPGDEYGGLGIGLATVERIIHRHGGRIWAEAAPDKGATFYFTLPESQEAN